jgi:hypothetical protein
MSLDIKLITSIDEGLKFFRQLIETYHSETLEFEYCNGYILQATRNGFFAWESDENITIFTKRDDGYVIIASAGKERGTAIWQMAHYLHEHAQTPVKIKNVNHSLERELLNLGFRHYRVDEWWNGESKYDDNSFPEQVLETEALTKLEGSEYQSLREERNRFNRESQIVVSKIKYCTPELVEGLLVSWIDNMYIRNGWDKKELRASHEIFFVDRPDLMQYGAYDSNNNLIGLLVFSEISSQCLGFNVLINDFELRNLYRILMFEAAKIANSLGYPFLNIQGSEDTNQYLSKRRMHSKKEIYKEHLIFDGNHC